VIPKVHDRGPLAGLRGMLHYLFGPGLDNERGGRHDNPRVIAAWAYATAGNLADLQPPPTPNGRLSVRRLTELLEQPVQICWTVPALPVWHCSIHNHPDDPILTDQQWSHIATEIAAAVGLAPRGDLSAVRWIGIRHAEAHIHLVATLARQDRRAVWLWRDYRRAQACCRELEQHYGLHRVDGRRHGAQRHPKPAELNKTTRQQRDEVPRHRLRRLVHAAAGTAANEHDFLDRLRTSGLLVRPRAKHHQSQPVRRVRRRATRRPQRRWRHHLVQRIHPCRRPQPAQPTSPLAVAMSADPPAKRRRRAYVFPGRQKRLSIRVTDSENTEIVNAANQIRLTPTGFCAHAALDAARHLHTGTTERMEREALGNLQAELFQARVTLNQLRVELEHARNDTRATTDDLDKTVTRTDCALADLDSASARIHHRLGLPRSTGPARRE